MANATSREIPRLTGIPLPLSINTSYDLLCRYSSIHRTTWYSDFVAKFTYNVFASRIKRSFNFETFRLLLPGVLLEAGSGVFGNDVKHREPGGC